MKKNQGGRPSKYKKEYCESLVDHMAKGFSFASFAGLVGVCEDTLFEWADAHSEFDEAKSRAFAKCQLFWEQMGSDGAWNFSGEGSKNLNTTYWIFNMKNRFKWRDKHADEHDTKVEVTQVNEVNRAEIESLKQELLALVKK
jgi:hypothetical protein